MTASAAGAERETMVDVALVDCDVHPWIANPEELVDWVAEPWRSRYYTGNLGEVEGYAALYAPPLHILRLDAFSEEGGLPGTDPATLEKQVFQDAGVDFAVLLSLQPRGKLGQPEFETAIYAACNGWMADTWLSQHNRHGRFRGALRVCPYDAAGAATEIERWAGHPGFCEVFITPEAGLVPFGNPQFFPVLEAAARADLPIAMHVFRTPGTAMLTPVGYPAYHLEIFPQWPLHFMSHLASLIFEGVFDRLENLKVVGVEGGFTWIPQFMWRLDRYWEALGRELTGARRRPSEYVKDHMRFTTQPLEEPTPAKALEETMQWLGADDVLMFATDYPHYDYDDPGWLIPRLPKQGRERILCGNAIELYGLPSKRPFDEIDRAAGREPQEVAV